MLAGLGLAFKTDLDPIVSVRTIPPSSARDQAGIPKCWYHAAYYGRNSEEQSMPLGLTDGGLIRSWMGGCRTIYATSERHYHPNLFL